jgi:hypothetical protein
VLALETVPGTRVIASPSTLDAVAWPSSAIVLRFAPDDVFVIGGESISVSGDSVIVAPDAGFAGAWLTAVELAHVAEHIDWPLPTERPAFAQGFVASVPAKLYLTGAATSSDGGDRVALLLTNTPYAHELQERLS